MRFDVDFGCFREIMVHHPEDAAAFFDLGDALFDMGQLAEADAVYREGSLLDPGLAASRPGTQAARQDILLAQTRDELRAEIKAQPAEGAGLGHLFWGVVLSLGDRLRGSRGEAAARSSSSHRTSWVALALIVVVAWLSWVVLPPYIAHYQLRDKVVQIARASVRTEAEIKERLMHAVADHGLENRLQEGDFLVEAKGHWRRVECAYSVPVSLLPGLAPRLRFEIRVEEPFLLEPDPIIF